MDDLNDHPFMEFMRGESYVSPREKAWLAWVKKAEGILGHSLDGDEDADGYSLDAAYDWFAADYSPAEYVEEISA